MSPTPITIGGAFDSGTFDLVTFDTQTQVLAIATRRLIIVRGEQRTVIA